MDFSFLISNPLINTGVISWIIAQLIKTLISLIKHKKFDKSRLAGAGGMPSSHSAIVCSAVLTSYFEYGYESGTFAIAFIVALIVMYDATGVRWAAGLHAKAINNIVEYLEEKEEHKSIELVQLIPTLNESLGHRMIEVFCGAVLGIVVSLVAHII